MKTGLIFVISGPSGSGKTTLVDHLLKDRLLGRKLARSISFTTRPKRSREINKRDYFFITGEEFHRALNAKKILEWTKYLGYYYGTPKQPVDKQLKAGKNIILCLDFKGASRIKRIYPHNAVTIFIKPPSLGALLGRIKNRCSKTKEREVLKRVMRAKKELALAHKYDYRVVNRDLKTAFGQLKKVILKHTESTKKG